MTTEEERDEAGRLVSVVVDGQRFHRAPEAIEERTDEDDEANGLGCGCLLRPGGTSIRHLCKWHGATTFPKTWQGFKAFLDEMYPADIFPNDGRDLGPSFVVAARRLSEVENDLAGLRGVVQAQQVKLAAVESLLPFSDAEYPIYPFQLRGALGAEESDFLLIPRAALAAAADAPQPEPAKITYGPRVPSRRVDLSEWDSHRPDFLPAGPSPAVLPEREQQRSSDELEAVKRDRARLIAELHGAHRERDSLRRELERKGESIENRDDLLADLRAERDTAIERADHNAAAVNANANMIVSLRGVVQAQRDEMFPIDRDDEPNAADLAQGAEWWARTCIWWSKQCRKAWAERDGLVAAAADAPQPADEATKETQR